MSDNIKYLDSHRSLESIFARDYKSQRFVIGVVTTGEEGEDEYRTYASEELTARDLSFLADVLKEIAMGRGV